jgi:succinyl-diaminopimelate desuccinylase
MNAAIDAVALARALIHCPSVTPRDEGAQTVLAEALESIGFRVWRHVWGDAPDGPVHNLFARLGSGGPHFAFAGHTDVVPVGNREQWSVEPFAAEVRDGQLVGRGAADMKGAIAAFAAAVADFGKPATGSISLVITGDEEGPAIHGTKPLLEWMEATDNVPDACLVGEPTSRQRLGDVVKIGRRGSVNVWLTVTGAQGHVAYPHMADNPVRHLVNILHALQSRRLDAGNAWFDASNLEVTDIHVGNAATNIIPATAEARLNIRFNDEHRGADLVAWIEDVAARETSGATVVAKISGEAFLTQPGPLSALVAEAITAETGIVPHFSTSGGTSDARFIRRLCPVVECGLVGQSMHKVDEHASVDDIRALTRIYRGVLARFFS